MCTTIASFLRNLAGNIALRIQGFAKAETSWQEHILNDSILLIITAVADSTVISLLASALHERNYPPPETVQDVGEIFGGKAEGKTVAALMRLHAQRAAASSEPRPPSHTWSSPARRSSGRRLAAVAKRQAVDLVVRRLGTHRRQDAAGCRAGVLKQRGLRLTRQQQLNMRHNCCQRLRVSRQIAAR